MAEDKRFHFGGVDDLADAPLYQADSEARRIDKIGRRVSLIFILLPILFGLLWYFGYRDLSGKLNRTQDSRLQEIQQLNEDILDQFETFSARLETLEAGRTAAENSLQQMRSALKSDVDAAASASAAAAASAESNTASIKMLSAELESIEASKLDKAALNQIDSRFDAALAPLEKDLAAIEELKAEMKALAPLREQVDSFAAFRQELEAVSGRLTALENSLGKDLNAFATYVEKTNQDLDQIEANITALSKDKIGPERLRRELLEANKSNRLALLKEITKIQKTLNAIESRVNQLERTPPRSSTIRPPSQNRRSAAVNQPDKVSEQELTD